MKPPWPREFIIWVNCGASNFTPDAKGNAWGGASFMAPPVSRVGREDKAILDHASRQGVDRRLEDHRRRRRIDPLRALRAAHVLLDQTALGGLGRPALVP